MRCLALTLCLLIADPELVAAPPGGPANTNTNTPERRPIPKGINFYSRSHEIEMGRDLARDLDRSVRLIEDPVLCEYVNRIAQNLARQADTPFVLKVRIIRSDEANSLALPGGYIYVNSGLIRAANNEAELAVAIAHEVGHVAARHYTRQASWGDIFTAAQVPLMMIGGWPGLLAQEGARIATPLALKKLSRGAETEADRLGIQYLYDAGYDPTAFVDFMERISLQEIRDHGVFAALLASHPALASRIRAAQKVIQKTLLPKSLYLLQTSEFETAKQRLIKIESGVYMPWKPVHSPAADADRPVLRRNP